MAALLPDSATPYIVMMGAGFLIAIWGHGMRSRWVVAVGIILIFLSTLLFPLALQIFSDEPPPPGPKVPLSLIAPAGAASA